MKHLTIISHTEHYLNSDGMIVGLGSTITEINHLLQVFDKITHIAMLHASSAPPNALPYSSDRIKFVPITAVGGPTLADKVSILKNIPKIISLIRKHLRSSDYFQFRAPTGIGVFVIPYLILFTSKNGWFKYAGNWKQEHAPLAYRFQKWLLEHQSRTITINGFWDGQPQQCLSFENPCLTTIEMDEGIMSVEEKSFRCPFNFCFVGRLEPAKGVDLIIDAISELASDEQQKIGVIHIVGDGERMPFYKQKTESIPVKFIFHGFLPRQKVHEIYKNSQAILLPSSSEGFPKVIAEGMNYGCIPIVSNVSSIGHYITDGHNGFLLNHITSEGLKASLNRFLQLDRDSYEVMTASRNDFIQKFTYAYYNQRLLDIIL